MFSNVPAKRKRQNNSPLEQCITQLAINRSLYFKPRSKLAFISGAGIAGLAASFELRAKGYKVIIADKRLFSRFNFINLDVESQRFLKKFGLLKEFEKNIAARITHKHLLLIEKGKRNLQTTDLRKIQTSKVPFEPEFFNKLFNQSGIYTVKIRDLQNFLAEKALEAGVTILGNVETEVVHHSQKIGQAKTKFVENGSYAYPPEFKPDFIFIAEGANSTTAKTLAMTYHEVKNDCSGENWIFGNTSYQGRETFVVLVIDTSQGNLEIANIIFNAKIHEANISVGAKRHLSQEQIQERILQAAKKIFHLQHIEETPQSLIACVKKPVTIVNEKRAVYSENNIFCIGDAAGHSSPLAAMGATLGLTLIPRTVEQLTEDAVQRPSKMHDIFGWYTEAYVSKWMIKSQTVKKFCLSFFKSHESAPLISNEKDAANTTDSNLSKTRGYD